MSKNSLKVVAFILMPTVITLVLWLLKYSSSSFPTSVTSLQLISGLTALTLYVQTILLSSRITFIEKLCGGYDTMYFYHKYISITATLFAIIHFSTYLIKAGGYPIQEIYSNLFSLELYEIGLKLGVVSFYTILLFIAITYIKRVPYHIWKVTHNYMGLLFILASVHAILIGRDLQSNNLLTAWIFFISIIGVIAFLYIRFFWKTGASSHVYRVNSITLLGQICEISLVSTGKRLEYVPAQFGFLSFQNPLIGNETHPYTLSSSPHEDTLRFSIKMSGDYTSKLPFIQKGETALIQAPYGSFGEKFMVPTKPLTFIGGGIGVTPFLSMVHYARFDDSPREIDFWYLVRTPPEAVYISEIETIQQNLTQTKITLHTKFSQTDGYTTASDITQTYPDYKNRYYFICGPSIMMKKMIDDLIELGVSKHYIISEDFSFKV
jgi:predicted ferric reductase